MWEAIIILAVFIVAVSVTLVRVNKTPNTMSFREAMDLAELPIVTFRIGEKKANFILDTGANASVINKCILDKIDHEVLDKTHTVMGIEGIASENPCVSINLKYRDQYFQEEFQAIDMSGVFSAMKQESGVVVHGLIGNAFFTKYKYVLDFKDLIAYSKK